MNPTLYPQARRDETVVEVLAQCKKVADPYRWLEDPDAEETKKFVDAANAISLPFIKECEDREKIQKRLTDLWNYEKYSCFSKHGEHYFYSHNKGLQNQAVMYILEGSLDATPRVFIDPNTLSDDGTTALGEKAFTEDGSLVAYTVRERGSDWASVHFRRSPSSEKLGDVLEKVRFSSLAWMPDNSGLFYCMYPHVERSEGTNVEGLKHHSLYYHKLGTPQTEDVLCVRFDDFPDYMIGAEVTEDGSYLVLGVSKGCDPMNLLYYFDLRTLGPSGITDRLPIKTIVDKYVAKYSFIDNVGPRFILKTDDDAPMFKLITIEADKLKPDTPLGEQATTLIAENPEFALDWATLAGKNLLLLSYMEHAKDVMFIHKLEDGSKLYKLNLEVGTISGFFAHSKRSEIFYKFSSFLTPGQVFHVPDIHALISASAVQPKLIREEKVAGFDSSAFTTEQIFFKSREDDTQCAMFVVRPRAEIKEPLPTIMYGYGGFDIAMQPSFSITRLIMLQHYGGLYVTVNTRGGSEYGKRWHEAGMLEKKVNVFNDFISAGQELVDRGYTTPQQLAIEGGSNGGLLVAACAQMRPGLFAAVANHVGVLDMMRFHRFTIGKAWVPEFGDPENADHIDFLLRYSPLHCLKTPCDKESQYPAMLLLTADHDDRVVPLHSLKYMAELYHCVKDCPHQTNPLLLRVETKAGHGAGKPTTKIIEEKVDLYCFLQRALNLKWRD